MNKQYQKIFSVLFAILVGAGVIFFAWRGVYVDKTDVSALEKNNDWKDSLSVVPQTDFLKTLSVSRGTIPESIATSTADIVARELFINYTLAQKNNMSTTTMSDAEATAIAQAAISKIDLPKAKQYKISDLNLSKLNTPESLDTYSKNLERVVNSFALSQTKNDIQVVFAIPTAGGDSKRLADISKNIAHYEKLINELLAIETPPAVAQPHLHFLQKYTNIQATIKPMSEIFTDTTKGLAALAEYRKEIAGFTLISEEFKNSLSKIQ